MNILLENIATCLVKSERGIMWVGSDFSKGVIPLYTKDCTDHREDLSFLSPDFSGQATFIS